jgi:hypothetical protein
MACAIGHRRDIDLLELSGKDLRLLPLGERKAKLARLLAGSSAGIVFNEHTGEDGPIVFQYACRVRVGGHRLEAAHRALPLRAVAGLD